MRRVHFWTGGLLATGCGVYLMPDSAWKGFFVLWFPIIGWQPKLG
jgi:hypothetical protein